MKKYKNYPETTFCYFSTISITAWLPIFQGAHYVQKRFVELPEHWKYSSARNWLKEDDSIIEIDRDFII